MKKTLSIENKTVLLPHIIAEGAFWDALENTDIKGDPENDYNLQQEIAPKLVERANVHFNNNIFFKKKVCAGGNNGRDYLWMMMIHWSYSLLKNKYPRMQIKRL